MHPAIERELNNLDRVRQTMGGYVDLTFQDILDSLKDEPDIQERLIIYIEKLERDNMVYKRTIDGQDYYNLTFEGNTFEGYYRQRINSERKQS